MPTSTANGSPSTFFEPRDAESLWKLVTTPHPLVGKAKHLGEALVNANMLAPDTLMTALRAQQVEREQGVKRPIGQILVEQGHLSQNRLREAIASWLGEYVVDPAHLQPDATALALVPQRGGRARVGAAAAGARGCAGGADGRPLRPHTAR